MILLSDDLPDGSGGGGAHAPRQHAGSVTHPFVTQTYCCVAAYETKDTKNRPFKVEVDERLDVLIKEPAGQCSQSAKRGLLSSSIKHCELSSHYCVFFSLQVGGWWKMRKSAWLGFPPPISSYVTEKMATTLDSSWEVRHLTVGLQIQGVRLQGHILYIVYIFMQTRTVKSIDTFFHSLHTRCTYVTYN